jgi:hypothetical protein
LRIDSSHKKWAIGTGGALAIAGVAYWFYGPAPFSGAFGGTLAGLIFGGLGAAAMLFAFTLNLRKLRPVWRRGPAQRWMRGHLWLGLLSYPLILFHSGFKAGGFLTSVLMWVFPFVILTGILGAVLQHFMPRVMSETIDEGIYSQIGHLQEELVKRAEKSLSRLRIMESEEDEDLAGSGAQTAVASATKTSANPVRQLLKKYEEIIKPYLISTGGSSVGLEGPHASEILFGGWKKQLPNLQDIIGELEDICHEKRDLYRQKRLHFYLHSWLLAHVPLSIFLVVLGTVHAVMAFRY